MAVQPDIATMIANAVADALALAQPGAPGNEPEKPATRKPARGTRKAAPVGKASARKPARKPRNVPAGVLTAGDCWLALGADPAFEPNDHARTAFLGRQLDLLNSQGRLAIVDPA